MINHCSSVYRITDADAVDRPCSKSLIIWNKLQYQEDNGKPCWWIMWPPTPLQRVDIIWTGFKSMFTYDEKLGSLEILIWISGVVFWREKWWLLTDDLTNDQDFALLAYWPPLPPAKDGGWVTRVGWWLGAIFVWLKPGTGPYWVAGKKP